MFTIKTRLDKSAIHGIGVFAEEFVPKGVIVHEYLKDFDIIYSDEQYEKLPEQIREYVLHYGYYSEGEGGYVLCGDNGRFVNHSKEPNIQMFDKINTIATKDIQVGDEITEDYFYFDEKANLKFECGG